MPRTRQPDSTRKADPALQRFIDALREVIDKDPLYRNPRLHDVDRFYVGASELPTTPVRTRSY